MELSRLHDKVDAELWMIPSMLETMNRKRRKENPQPGNVYLPDNWYQVLTVPSFDKFFFWNQTPLNADSDADAQKTPWNSRDDRR